MQDSKRQSTVTVKLYIQILGLETSSLRYQKPRR